MCVVGGADEVQRFGVTPAGASKRRLVLRGRGRSLRREEGVAPQTLFLPSFHHHGRMDHFGEAAGGSCPAALHHDWKVRRRFVV